MISVAELLVTYHQYFHFILIIALIIFSNCNCSGIKKIGIVDVIVVSSTGPRWWVGVRGGFGK
jgi:hypothetical protein